MSVHTIKVDQFILNKLQPEIDRLNLSLVSMEENGYDNIPMRETKKKLNQLIVIYDFLKEYAYGNEETNDVDSLNNQINDREIDNIMRLVGSYNYSNRTQTPIIQSTRNSLEINETGGCQNFIRIYLNNKIVTSTILSPLIGESVFKIYGSDQVTSMSVVVTLPSSSPITYTGVNNVTIEDIQLSLIDSIIFEVTTTNICGQTFVQTIYYEVLNIASNIITYWRGSTPERFTISLTDLNESSNIVINPNAGSNTSGIILNYTWITNNSSMSGFLFRENVTEIVKTNVGDSHALLLIPTSLTTSNFQEIVSGEPVDMTLGLHYDIFTITDPALHTYNCIYFRDLTSLHFTEVRTFQFNISKV